jgi:sulfur-oxidizing protein SoxX
MQAVPAVKTAALAGLMLVAPLCAAGDAARGAAIAASRSEGLCVLCHTLPGVNEAQGGALGPSLAGVGARLTTDELRARLLAPEQFNPATVMPAYARREGFTRVASARRGQPLLSPRQIDDVVAYLTSLR